MKFLLAALVIALPLSASAADSFVGVGMVLQQAENRVFVEQIVAGAPVERDGRIKAGDEVVAVQSIEGQGNPWVSVSDLPLDQVVGMIRGEEGTRVGLHMVNATGQFEVFLTREKIDLP